MEKIYACNHLEVLCQKLGDNIQNLEQDVFAKEIIITQSNGMNAWLKTELAGRNGIFANFDFHNQDGFFSAIYQLLFGERLQNTIDVVKFKVYELIGSNDFVEKFPNVASYYESNELRRFQLSAKIADLFDQYQLYRPEILKNWESGHLSTDNSDENWQQWLWKELGIEAKAKIKEKIINRLEEKSDLIKKTYPVISFFGITIYTHFHFEFYKELAKYTSVNFYLCLPSIHSPFRNELLENFGSKAEELMGMFNIPDLKTQQNNHNTLLSQIQNEILNNTIASAKQEDDSLQINSCFTPAREAECLCNYLLDLFEKDKKLRPRDVLVMTTDINKYAPYIKAVFRNAPVNIPFQVSGAANNSDDSMTAALEQILNFTEEDLTSEKVISLLEQKRIKQRFGIQDCNYIRSVVRKANIRFGRENRAEDDTRYVSWKVGIEKILLGYAMLTDEAFPIDKDLNLFPFKDAEASSSYDLFRLKGFVSAMETVIDIQKQSKTLSDWKQFLFADVMEKMIYRDDFNKDDRAELNSIYRAISFTDSHELNKEVSFSVFLDELKTKLFTESLESKLNTGRVTVSSPIPVRGLPFKVICFLGLNNDIFPRRDRFMGFDLLGEEYLEGDRNIKETDKYLFLDTILAAREKLYLSYIGQSVKDNTEIPPSIVLDTLLDYIGQEEFVVKHPLHGFSSRYQKDNKRLFTYLYAEQGNEFVPKEQKPEELTEISVNSFVKFFEHPIEWYFKNILGIKYEEKDDTLSETELFELDHLQKWQIKNDLLKLNEEGIQSYLQKGTKEGILPLKNLGRVCFDELIEDTATIRSTYQSITRDKEERNITIDLNIDNIQITGTIDGVYDREYIAFSLSKSVEKNMVRAYLKTLLLCAKDEIGSALLINADGESTNLPVFSSSEAKLKIKELLVHFNRGMDSPLKFTLKSNDQVKKKAKVVNIFEKEAIGYFYASLPPNHYVATLYEEKYFKKFDVDDFGRVEFNKDIYNDPKYDEIRTIGKLLNL